METYFNYLPSDILIQLLYYLDDESTLIFVNSFQHSGYEYFDVNGLHQSQLAFELLVRYKFTGLYRVLKNLVNLKKYTWITVWYWLKNSISDIDLNVNLSPPPPNPDDISDDMESGSDDIPLEINLIYERYKITPEGVIYSKDFINYPDVVYEAIFLNEFPEAYDKLKEIKDVRWGPLYLLFKDNYSSKYIDIDFDEVLKGIFNRNAEDTIKLLKILYQFENIAEMFEDDIDEIIKNINNPEVIKWMYTNLPNQNLAVVDYLIRSIDIKDLELFQYILANTTEGTVIDNLSYDLIIKLITDGNLPPIWIQSFTHFVYQ